MASTPGAGSSFRLHLPHRLPPAPETPARASAQAGPRLLLVEANPLARGVTIHGLREAGVTADAVATLADAHHRIEADGPALLLISTDAGTSPDALAALLGSARATGSAPLVLIDPHGPFDPARLRAMGAAQVLTRPIPLTTLAAALGALGSADPRLAA